MSARELNRLIQAKTSSLLGEDTKSILNGILHTAESEAILQIRSIPVEPNTNPLAVQEQTGNIRMEMLTEAIMSFLTTMHGPLVGAVSEAFVEYLNAHSTGDMIPMSLYAPNGPVKAKNPVVKIRY